MPTLEMDKLKQKKKKSNLDKLAQTASSDLDFLTAM